MDCHVRSCELPARMPMRETFPIGCALAASGTRRRPRARVMKRPRALRRMVESSNIHGRSPWASSGVHPRVDPGEIGWLAMEQAGHSLHQQGVGGAGVETTRFDARTDALHPPVAFLTGRPQGPPPPQDATEHGA